GRTASEPVSGSASVPFRVACGVWLPSAPSSQTAPHRVTTVATRVAEDLTKGGFTLRRPVAQVPLNEPGHGLRIGQGEVIPQEGGEVVGGGVPALALAEVGNLRPVGGNPLGQSTSGPGKGNSTKAVHRGGKWWRIG